MTVGIPVYNGERYLAQTLEAVRAQTFDDFEVVVVDNASTDRTADICAQFADSLPLSYHRNAVNRGAAYNFNRVLELARGEYFKWLAADDLCAPDLLTRCVEALDAAPGAVLAYPRMRCIDGEGQTLYRFEDVADLSWWPDEPAARARRLLEVLVEDGRAAMVLIFGLARTETLRSIRPLGNYYGADWTVVLELALAGGLVEVPEQLAAFRRHERSSSWEPVPTARGQQQFYDPAVRHRARVAWQFRRRWAELARSIAAAPLNARERALLLAWLARLLGRRAGRRAGYELRRVRGAA